MKINVLRKNAVFFAVLWIGALALLLAACPPPDSDDGGKVVAPELVTVKTIIFDNLNGFSETANSADVKDFQRAGASGHTAALSTEQNHTPAETGKSLKWSGRTNLNQKIKFDTIFTARDEGRTFNISLWIYPAAAAKFRLGVFSLNGGAFEASPKAQSPIVSIPAGQWSELSWNGYTHTAGAVTQLGVYQTEGAVVETVYIDDILIKATKINGSENAPENLAQGKTATASTGTNAQNAVDGNAATKWESEEYYRAIPSEITSLSNANSVGLYFTEIGADTDAKQFQHLTVDLGGPVTVNKVTINHDTSGIYAFSIQVSNDNSAYTNVTKLLDGGASGSAKYNGEQTFWFTARQARYVRYHAVLSPFSRTKAVLGEIAVYNDPADPPPPQSPAPVTGMELYLFIGQSNMQGSASYGQTNNEASMLPVPANVKLLSDEARAGGGDYAFVDASRPFVNHIRENFRYVTSGSGSGGKVTVSHPRAANMAAIPHYVANLMAAEKPSAQFGLIINPLGGSSMADWSKICAAAEPAPLLSGSSTDYLPTANLYAVTRAKMDAAKQHGALRGIFWHQGESNNGAFNDNERNYLRLLQKLVADLRADLNAHELPFIAGEIAITNNNDVTTTSGNKKDFNANLQRIAEFIPFSAAAPATVAGGAEVDLIGSTYVNADGVHFTAAALEKLSADYWRLYKEINNE